MEWVLQAFSNLILFTFGLIVLAMWIVIIFIIVDEIIDLVLHRNNEEDES